MVQRFMLILVILMVFAPVSSAQDINNDDAYTPSDLIYVLNRLGESISTAPLADVDGDGMVTMADLNAVFRYVNHSFEDVNYINDYIVYYNWAQCEVSNSSCDATARDALAQYDMAIITPPSSSPASNPPPPSYDPCDEDQDGRYSATSIGTLNAQQIQEMREAGTLLIAYLSVGEIEEYVYWCKDVRAIEGALGVQNPNFPDSTFIDTRIPEVRNILRQIATEYINLGFDGLFLDTVDNADFTNTNSGMIALIDELNQDHPDAIIIQNRGFAVLPDTQEYIDAVMYESFSTTWQYDNDEFVITANDIDSDIWMNNFQATQNAQAAGVTVLTLDYVDFDRDTGIWDTAAIQAAQDFSLGKGFIPFVSSPDLFHIPPDQVVPWVE